MSVQIEAIVLKNFDYQDHHKIVKMISPSHGLISVFVSYANKKQSRYRMIAEPMTKVMITVKSPTNDPNGLYYLVHGDVMESFYELKIDYELVMMFYEMAQIVLQGDLEMGVVPYAYRTLASVMEAAMATPDVFRLGVVGFKAKLMEPVGIVPAIDGCVECETTSKIVTASVSAGGLICENCYADDGIWLAAELIPLWRGIYKYPLDRVLNLQVSEGELEALEQWMISYYEGYSNIKFTKRLGI